MKDLDQRIGYEFRNGHLLKAALTHRSFRYENDDIETDNQRLEFLGDAVLGLIAAEYLFNRFRDIREGRLTHLRSVITNADALAAIADKLEIGSYLHLGKGEELSGGSERRSNLADALEALIGALYLDGGLDVVREFFLSFFVGELDRIMQEDTSSNPRGDLQELAQKQWKISPTYRIIQEEGPPHERTYTAEVRIADVVRATGSGSNKQTAHIEAARAALEQISKNKC